MKLEPDKVKFPEREPFTTRKRQRTMPQGEAKETVNDSTKISTPNLVLSMGNHKALAKQPSSLRTKKESPSTKSVTFSATTKKAKEEPRKQKVGRVSTNGKKRNAVEQEAYANLLKEVRRKYHDLADEKGEEEKEIQKAFEESLSHASEMKAQLEDKLDSYERTKTEAENVMDIYKPSRIVGMRSGVKPPCIIFFDDSGFW